MLTHVGRFGFTDKLIGTHHLRHENGRVILMTRNYFQILLKQRKQTMKKISLILILCFISLSAASNAQAGTVIGGSELLNSSSVIKLEHWLGLSDVTFTNIFTKQEDSLAPDFHTAVNGKGPTISIMRVSSYDFAAVDPVTGTPKIATNVVGGYNPQSWTDGNEYTLTPDLKDRTGFLFNIDDNLVLRQDRDEDLEWSIGKYQTYNGYAFGPTFGSGFDLYVDYYLNSGDSRLNSYTSDNPNLKPFESFGFGLVNRYVGGFGDHFDIYEIEVFTVSGGSALAVPELETYAMMIVGLGLISFISRQRINAPT